ncbi:MAG: type II secretion system F family protein [Methylococcales bacterium]|jgi:MSHA biogenesis protein MshG|nr:type II secretion system F family protein [Methylococcales bacterium]
MPFFNYTAKNKTGKTITGKIEGNTSAIAAEQLAKSGLIPIKVTEYKETNDPVLQFSRKYLEPKPTTTDVIMFSRQMNTLIRSGVPIIRSIDGLAESTVNKTLGRALKDIAQSLSSGKDLSQSLALHPKIFSQLYINIMKVGEQSGLLEDAFRQIAHYLELEKDTKERVKTAFRYPSFVLAAMIGGIGVINVFVIPNFASMFASSNVELPMPTKVLLASSEFMLAYWKFILAGIIASIFSFKYYIKTEQGRYNWDRIKLSIPLLGGIVKRSTLSRFARSFSMALAAGVPITQSLSMISKAVDNAYVAAHIIDMRTSVEKGETLTRVARNTNLFTPLVMQMLSVGEETGRTDSLLIEVAEFYEQEVDLDLKALSSSIEPILIIFMSIMVLMLAMGVFLPMWDIALAAK